MLGRIVAWILLLAALVVAGHDGLNYLQSGAYRPIGLGAIWSAAAPASLNLARSEIGRTVPILWQDVISPLLIWPAWAVLIGTGLAVGLLFGRRARRKWRSGSLG